VWVRRISGRPFLFVSDMTGEFLHVYRFSPQADGEIAIPCVLFAKKHIQRKDGYPAHAAPTKTGCCAQFPGGTARHGTGGRCAIPNREWRTALPDPPTADNLGNREGRLIPGQVPPRLFRPYPGGMAGGGDPL
jgi:hypothetical protein